MNTTKKHLLLEFEQYDLERYGERFTEINEDNYEDYYKKLTEEFYENKEMNYIYKPK